MRIEIDSKAGFCFGVRAAIDKVEAHLEQGGKLLSLGEIVHNAVEMNRLQQRGMELGAESDLDAVQGRTVLIRTHGASPELYAQLKDRNINYIDGTCPVVLKLQKRISEAYLCMKAVGGQVVIFGKPGHAEVIGLAGQTNNEALIISTPAEFVKVDTTRPFELFTQTTMPLDQFQELKRLLQQSSNYTKQPIHDSICRQVANRAPRMVEFATQFDVVLFVSGKNSSNGKALFTVCLKHNAQSYFISEAKELDLKWFNGVRSVGVTGATSTPMWLMEQVCDAVNELLTKR
jgi:4-hydroxy-3-methylbut-2-en-1-yl diphosphate reductase